MALYTFVGIFCSFIAVDITKFLISRKASGFLYLLNLLAVASLSIILANLLGFIWLMIYSELFITVWFPELYHFGQMFIAFFGSSIWMSIFFVPLFHYMHIKNKVQYKKWIYSAFLIIIIAIPLMTFVQNGKSEEGNLSLDDKNSAKTFYYMCHTGIENIYLVSFVDSDSILLSFFLQEGDERDRNLTGDMEFEDVLENKIKVKVNKNNTLTFASGKNASKNIYFELVRKKENIFYEYSNEFMKLNGRCVSFLEFDKTSEAFAIAKFLKSQGVVNQ
jgi:hypothetical protein